jgi:hypothetical protein
MADEISNRLAATLLIVAIVVSLGGTFISMQRLASMRQQVAVGGTGFATSATGVANLSISGLLSIIIKNQTVDFGVCTPPSAGVDFIEVNTSNFFAWNCSLVRGTGTGSTDVANKHLSVENDGNQDANVTIKTNAVASASFIGGFFPAFRYTTENLTTFEGCFRSLKYVGTDASGTVAGSTNGTTPTYVNFTAINTQYKACDNLTWRHTDAGDATCDGSPQDRCAFKVEFSVLIPSNAAPGTYTADITFTANTV